MILDPEDLTILATLSTDDLMDEYRDEVVRMCAGQDGPERLRTRAALRSEIVRRARPSEPRYFA